jgi:DNA (cytosine-5)-methyltransferase 1
MTLQTIFSNHVIRTSTLSIQDNKDAGRLWIEGKYLEKAGFIPGSVIEVVWKKDHMIISLNTDGDRTVCVKRKSPLIDINNKRILKIFQVSEKVKAVIQFGRIVVSKSKKELRKMSQLHDGSCGEVFCGGGLLTESAKQAGFHSKWAIESNQIFADIWQNNHKGKMFNQSIADVSFEELEQVELLLGGIPCEPFSIIRRNQGYDLSEMHKNADLSMFFLMVVERVNPRVIVLEEVPYYLKSGIGIATIKALQRMGYNVQTEIVSGKDFGEFEIRKRAVIVATMGKINFPTFKQVERKMSEVLLNPEDARCEWFDRESKAWFFKHLDEQTAKGNNFAKCQQIITENSDYLQAITKRYLNIQPQNPIVAHPTIQGKFRLLTVDEIRKIKNIPEGYDLGVTKEHQGNILGQGVIINVFKKIIQSVAGVLV